jgi:hypothetical protein
MKLKPKAETKARAIYFADPIGDVEDERDDILDDMEEYGITMSIETTIEPPFSKRFDVLFFDWGGMSVGNDMMRHFCRDIIRCADDNPGRIFVMVSTFTEEAMEDALSTFSGNKPDNIYLNIDSAITALKVFAEPCKKPTAPKLNIKTV